MRAHRIRMTGAVGTLALTAGVVTIAAGQAQAAPAPGAAVVVNEVYGGGGNSGATYKRDFIELANVSASPVDLTGWSVQYNSTAGTNAWQKTDLTGTLPAGATLVVAEAAGTGGTTDVPFDVDGSIAISGTGGKVALVNSTTAMSGCAATCSSLPQVVDFVGWGAANDSAGGAPAPATTNTTSVSRNAAHANTANNAADFTAGEPTPSACGDACTGGGGPTGPQEATIAEVQGTGDASPLVGKEVIVQGVVTAAYPTGGFHGFYLQTEGTGPQPDPSGASDGIFVFQSGGSTSPLDPDVVVGNYVEVTGTVSEFSGLTEITAAADDIADAGDDFSPVQPLTIGWPDNDAGRESIEGMLFRPTGDYTVTNTFTTNQFGEVGLAVGDHPLMQNTEVAKPGTPEAAAVVADNAKRLVTLDDGSSSNFTASSFSTSTCGTRPIPCLLNGDLTPAYVSNTKPVRVGAPVRFTKPVVVDYRFSLWRFQPTEQVVGPDNAASPAVFTNTRTKAPDNRAINQRGRADLKVASFNVLNYFTDLGDQDPSCLAYYDRDDNGTNVREGCDQRGAWDADDLKRQTEKEVSAINALDAGVVGLMEVENSAKFGHDRDAALSALVDALNAGLVKDTCGPRTKHCRIDEWAYVPSSRELPSVDQQDFITSAIIYKPSQVKRVGASRALGTQSGETQAFGNAREPIGQVFRPKKGSGEDFLFVVNHFKSKGSAGPFPGDEDTGDGQGASVTSRIMQAQALRDWVPTVLRATRTKAVVMAGDYNSYTQEDPLDVLYQAGYTDVGSKYDPKRFSYSFSGLSGSLDHILVNRNALALSTGAAHWNINSGESVALQYSRYNYHATNFHRPDPYASSDHDPVVLGLELDCRRPGHHH